MEHVFDICCSTRPRYASDTQEVGVFFFIALLLALMSHKRAEKLLKNE